MPEHRSHVDDTPTPAHHPRVAEDVVAWRRHLHRHPELAFEERETAAFVADRLRDVGGYRIREGVAGTGVVADLDGPPGAPVVALRADMDALPVHETADVGFRSQAPGRMHACGHDGHVAMLLGVASLLPASDRGVAVRLVFQPSEETVGPDGRSGAERMVAEGVFEGVAGAFALHLEPSVPTGVLRLTSGPVMASLDRFRGTIRGRGGHGARPERTLDPVWMLAPVLSALQSVVARRVSPMDAAVLSVGRVSGGTTPNVIPSEVEVEGTLRAFRPEVRALLRDEVGHVFGLVRSLGGDVSVDIQPENPELHNDPAASDTIARAARRLWPDVRILEEPYGMLSEDFGFVAKQVPAAMAMLGCAPERPSELHSPDFDIDERALPLGVELLREVIGVAAL